MTQRLQGRRAGDARRKENLKKLTITTAERTKNFQHIRDLPASLTLHQHQQAGDRKDK